MNLMGVVVQNGKPCALVVEDEVLVAMLAVDALTELGFSVLEANSAANALTIAAKEIAQLDLALVDLGLPDRPGEVLVSELKEMRPDLPIIVASGRPLNERELDVQRLGQVAVLMKPYDATRLRLSVDALGLALERRQSERAREIEP
jgi:DNA-binding response OmpR family regulator